MALQAVALKRRFSDSGIRVRSGKLLWMGEITPSPLSCTYTVQVQYRLGERPKVKVVKPGLRRRGKERCEHMYADDEPCLYWPKQREWDGSMLIVDTIIPWTCEWLTHYEIWLFAGKWHGQGVHPETSEKGVPERRALLRSKRRKRLA